MVKLGFYQNENEYLTLMDPIISLLDGSNDFHSKEEEEAFNIQMKKIKEEEQNNKDKKKLGKNLQKNVI